VCGGKYLRDDGDVIRIVMESIAALCNNHEYDCTFPFTTADCRWSSAWMPGAYVTRQNQQQELCVLFKMLN